MCTTEHTDRIGQSDASGPNCQPDGRSIPELLAEVETLTRRSEWLLTDYLTTVAKGWQRVRLAEDALAGAVADSLALLDEPDRQTFLDLLADLPGHRADYSPDSEPF